MAGVARRLVGEVPFNASVTEHLFDHLVYVTYSCLMECPKTRVCFQLGQKVLAEDTYIEVI